MKQTDSIVQGILYLLNQMIFLANSRKNVQKGDPKVGGHSSASASCLHILGALHLFVRSGFDFIANKPHASPTDHSYHYLLNLLLDKQGNPLSEEDSRKAMEGLRAFPSETQPYVFQSYHSHYDPDHHHFLPSGTVGIPPVVLGYLALAYKYLADHGYSVPPAHFWALIGDSEFREGSLFEAMPDLAEREVGSLTWMIDYNRQSLDGHRSTHVDIGTDDKRIEKTFLANGWEVVQVRHGKKRQAVFKKKGGKLFQNFLENEISDIETQILIQLQDSQQIRKFLLKKQPTLKSFLSLVKDSELFDVVKDLGGHDMEVLVQALKDSKKNLKKPTCLIIHTIKGWGLEMAGKRGNHSAIPSKEEIDQLRANTHFPKNSLDFPKFNPSSLEGKFLKTRGEGLLKEIHQQKKIFHENQKK